MSVLNTILQPIFGKRLQILPERRCREDSASIRESKADSWKRCAGAQGGNSGSKVATGYRIGLTALAGWPHLAVPVDVISER